MFTSAQHSDTLEAMDSVSGPDGSFPAIPELADPDTMDLNPLNDSSLTQILDELQEGTLLSLLEDDHLFSDLRDCPLSPTLEPLSCLNGGADGVNLDSFDAGLALEELFGEHCELVEFGSRVLDTASFNGRSEVESVSSDLMVKASSITVTPDEGDKPEKPDSVILGGSKPEPQSQPSVPLPKVTSSGTVMANSAPSTLRKRALKSCEKAPGCKKPRVSHSKGTAAMRPSSGSDSDISSTDSDSVELAAPKALSRSYAKCSGRPAVASTADPKYLLTCVKHDHCYTMQLREDTPGGQSSPLSVGDTSIEEGNNSDAGTCTHIHIYTWGISLEYLHWSLTT